MTFEEALAFLAFSIVVAGTPGPSNTLLTAVGANVGVLRGLPAVLGVACGMGVLMFAVTFGLGALLVQPPFLLTAVKLSGAAVLVWLAWRIATSTSSSAHTTAPEPVSPNSSHENFAVPSTLPPPKSPMAMGRPVGFLGAAAFQWVNPKSWLACTSAAGTFAAGLGVGHAALVALLFVAAALPSCFVWLAFGAGVQRLLRSERAARTFNLLMAGTL